MLFASAYEEFEVDPGFYGFRPRIFAHFPPTTVINQVADLRPLPTAIDGGGWFEVADSAVTADILTAIAADPLVEAL